jgi:hypothetical protein
MGSQAWRFTKGPWKNSQNPGPIMSPHTCTTFLSILAKKNMKEKEKNIVVWNEKVNKYTRGQKTQSTLNISQEKNIISMRHILR